MHFALDTRKWAVIVDMDGTLVDVGSVRHHVLAALQPDGSYTTRDFDAFHRASVDCPAIETTVRMVEEWYNLGFDILIVTARSEKYEGPTSWWLAEHNIPHQALYMRGEKDQRPDSVVKEEMLRRIEGRWSVQHAIDDNPSVVKLWESHGIPVTVVPGWLD